MVFNQEQEVSRVFLLIPDEIFAAGPATSQIPRFRCTSRRRRDVPTAAAVPAVHVHVCVTGDRSCVCTDAYYSVKHLTSI